MQRSFPLLVLLARFIRGVGDSRTATGGNLQVFSVFFQFFFIFFLEGRRRGGQLTVGEGRWKRAVFERSNPLPKIFHGISKRPGTKKQSKKKTHPLALVIFQAARAMRASHQPRAPEGKARNLPPRLILPRRPAQLPLPLAEYRVSAYGHTRASPASHAPCSRCQTGIVGPPGGVLVPSLKTSCGPREL